MWKLYLRLLTIACVSSCILAQNQPDFPEFFRYYLQKRPNTLPQINTSIQVCGKQLADMLALLCDGNYNSYKKSTQDPRPEDSWMEPSSVEAPPPPPFPYRSHSKAANVMARTYTRARRDIGIVQECCWRSCRVSDMLNYCAPTDATTSLK